MINLTVTFVCCHALPNLFCRRCHRPGKLPHDAVSALAPLCQGFANIMLYLVMTKRLFISTPTIRMPFLAISLALGVNN